MYSLYWLSVLFILVECTLYTGLVYPLYWLSVLFILVEEDLELEARLGGVHGEGREEPFPGHRVHLPRVGAVLGPRRV